MSLGRQQAGQLTGTLTGPPERGHGIAAGIRVNQSFQRLDQLGVVLDQRLPSSSRVPYSLNGERWLSKAVDSPIDGRTRESAKTGDAGNTPSSQLLCIDGSDKVLLSLIQVRKQQAVFLLKFFCCAHTDSVTQCASFVTIINLRALTDLALYTHRMVADRTHGRQHPVLGYEKADNFILAYYAGGEATPKRPPFEGQPEIEPEPGAFRAIDQRYQVVRGTQTNIAGNTQGPVLSGTFRGPVTVGGHDGLTGT